MDHDIDTLEKSIEELDFWGGLLDAGKKYAIHKTEEAAWKYVPEEYKDDILDIREQL